MPTRCGCGKEYTDYGDSLYSSGSHRIPFCQRCEVGSKPKPPELKSRELPIRTRCLYFIQCDDDGPIKIGVTVDLSGRLQALQLANHHELKIIATENASLKREKELHERFGYLKIRGEWFKPGNELLAYIDVLRESQDSLDN